MEKLALGVHPKNGAPIKVMIVDDSKVIRLMLRQILLSENFDIILEAENGEDAIRKLREAPEKPALYFSDIEMPKKGGLETIPDVKAICPDIKIVMITGLNDESKVKEAIGQGIDGYIIKPRDPASSRKEFLERLAKILKRDDYYRKTV